ncbi:hypothetical protein J437_LFUL008879 [Ladona fulva]|uniref:Uncharacterized protein n=1 Tax=Ladona fulva TaxID=123851 RepID=A0A8K0KD38_LADFU|nr:hypothetical protein J437_LFUL008879 [Ladona fulva]
MNLGNEGDEAATKLMKEITTTTTTRAKREKALSLIINSELIKFQYKIIRLTAEKIGHKLYPSYEKIRKAKCAAYPEGIVLAEDSCEVNLQSLLARTATRIVESVSTVPASERKIKCSLTCKYGFDRSSRHSQYKQEWQQEGRSDEFLFMSSLVPHRLVNENSSQ